MPSFVEILAVSGDISSLSQAQHAIVELIPLEPDVPELPLVPEEPLEPDVPELPLVPEVPSAPPITQSAPLLTIYRLSFGPSTTVLLPSIV